MSEQRSVEELLDAAEQTAVDPGASTGLDSIRETLSRDGVTVTVDLHGKLIGLEFTDSAMKLAPAELAARIQRLTTDAGTKALAAGLTVISWAAGEDVATAIGAELGIGSRELAPEPDAVGGDLVGGQHNG